MPVLTNESFKIDYTDDGNPTESGSVALKAAMALGLRVGTLILLEPNPFSLLRQSGRTKAFRESELLRDHVKRFGSVGNWPRVAERFSDYWQGDGHWSTMSAHHRTAFAESLRPNFYEWDAIMDEQTTIDEWKTLAARTLVISDSLTKYQLIHSVKFDQYISMALIGISLDILSSM